MNVSITGSKILFTIPVLGGINITDSIVVSWIVTAILVGLCFFLTHNLKVKPTSKRQLIAEMIVEGITKLVHSNMGERFTAYIPLIGALISMSALSNLISLTGLRSPTTDISTQVSWVLIVFALITYNKIKANGFGGYLKGFTKPIWMLTPLNLLSEVATPISMAFRHFGNIVSGMVINTLLYSALAALSAFVLSWAGSFIGSIPIFQIGIPAVLSIYFDLFTGLLHSYIFAMLTMIYVADAAGE